MKRILAIVALAIVLVAVVFAAFLLTGGKRFYNVSSNEQLITSFLLASVELIGLIVSIALVILILYQYIRYRRPYRLVFEAFSNESKLVDAENKPLNLSILAQEELVRQFKLIYRNLKEYTDKYAKDGKDKDNKDFEALAADELYIEEDLSGNDLRNYVSADQIKQDRMIGDLEDVIKELKNQEGINLMELVGEFVPKEVSPVMKFIETIFPPHIIRATGHLQGKSDKYGSVGGTFEFVDLGSQRNLLVRTLRWKSNNRGASADATPSAPSNTSNETPPNQESDHYIELLSPAMCWVALMFWEQNLISNVPFKNRIFKSREKKRKAQIYYLIGALYYAYARRLEAYSIFFCQLAVEHLRLALITDQNWDLPCLYLANLYTFKALEHEDELHKKLINEACELYGEALKRAEMRVDMHTQVRIILARSLAELNSGARTRDKSLIDRAIQGIEQLKALQDPANFDHDREDCAIYLYNLATWHQIAHEEYVRMSNIKLWAEARRYLAYSLARSREFWDAVEDDLIFKKLYEGDYLEKLKQELEKMLKVEPKLTKLKGEPFKIVIDRLLKNVDQLSQPVDTQTA